MSYYCLRCVSGEFTTGAEYVTTDMAKDAGDIALAGTLFNITKETCRCCLGSYETCINCMEEFYPKDPENLF